MGLYTAAMCAPLVGLLTWAAVEDVRRRRIPNCVTLVVMASGVAQSFLEWHTVPPSQAFAGLAVGFAVPLLFLFAGALGAGDVKLVAGVGAWIGPAPCLAVLALAALAAMVLATAQSIRQGRFQALVGNSVGLVASLLDVRGLVRRSAQGMRPVFVSIDKPLPYAVAVLIAMCVWLGAGAIAGR